jgi:CheY-like chemotaxis protein
VTAATILVVEDDELMRELFRMHLSNAGYEVLLAEDAVVAGHLLFKQRPDLILADIELPFMDGLEFVEAVKGDALLAAIPVIFVSSRSDFEDRCKDIGAIAFLKKPVLANQLLCAVAKHVEGGRLPL